MKQLFHEDEELPNGRQRTNREVLTLQREICIITGYNGVRPTVIFVTSVPGQIGPLLSHFDTENQIGGC